MRKDYVHRKVYFIPETFLIYRSTNHMYLQIQPINFTTVVR